MGISLLMHMESISLEGKTNFFENRVSQYQNSHVLNKGKNSNVNSFQLTEEFVPCSVYS